jgi:hypothetical protein
MYIIVSNRTVGKLLQFKMAENDQERKKMPSVQFQSYVSDYT